MPPDLALLSTLNGSNYPCLELNFMVPKVFEPLKFDCIYIYIYIYFQVMSVLFSGDVSLIHAYNTKIVHGALENWKVLPAM